jgi:hypothetical protein
MQLRVVCLKGLELFIEISQSFQGFQVMHLKKKILKKLSEFSKTPFDLKTSKKRKRKEEEKNQSQEMELATSYVIYRGKILMDPDFIELNSIVESDFFVFVQETIEKDEISSTKQQVGPQFKHNQNVTKLMEMGFDRCQAQAALTQVHHHLDHAIELLMGEHVPPLDPVEVVEQMNTESVSEKYAVLLPVLHDVRLHEVSSLAYQSATMVIKVSCR